MFLIHTKIRKPNLILLNSYTSLHILIQVYLQMLINVQGILMEYWWCVNMINIILVVSGCTFTKSLGRKFDYGIQANSIYKSCQRHALSELLAQSNDDHVNETLPWGRILHRLKSNLQSSSQIDY